MRLQHICNLLHAKIPQYTDEFSDSYPVTISISNGLATVTLNNHGLIIGDTFTLSGFSLDENVNYTQQVSRVVGVNSFIFEVVQKFITATNITGYLHKKVRAFISASVQLAIDSYAKQNGEFKKCLYVVDLGLSTSKDRSVGSDASFEMMRSTDFKMTFVNRFGILAILPIKNDIVGAVASEFSRELFSYFVKGITGKQLPTDWENQASSAITIISSNREVSNNAFIVQNYVFEITEYAGVVDVNADDFGYNINDINVRVIPKLGD